MTSGRADDSKAVPREPAVVSDRLSARVERTWWLYLRSGRWDVTTGADCFASTMRHSHVSTGEQRPESTVSC